MGVIKSRRSTPAEPGREAKCRVESREGKDLPPWIFAETHISCTSETCVVEQKGEHVIILSTESPLDHEFVVDSVCLNGNVGYRSASGDRSSNWTTDTIRVRGDKDFRRVSERVSRQIYAEGTAVDEAIEVTVTYDCLEARAVGVAPFWLTVDTKTSKP